MAMNLEQIYEATANGNRPDTIPAKSWLGRRYADNTIQRGASRDKDSGVHQINVDDEEGGYSLNGRGEAVFNATLADYDTQDPKGAEMLVKHFGPADLDTQAVDYRMRQYGGNPTSNPYEDRDYISGAPGLEG